MSDEPTVAKFHDVDDEEADKAVESMEHAIPHNEAIGRVLRNMYARLKKLETNAKKPKRSVWLVYAHFCGREYQRTNFEKSKIFGDRSI